MCQRCRNQFNNLFEATGLDSTKPPVSIITHPIEISEEFDPKEWEDFWPHSAGGTIFHSLRFLDYHPEGRFEHLHLAFRRKGNMVGLITGAIRVEEGSRVWVSHPGASYGGPAFAPGLKYHQIEDAIRALIEHLRKRGIARIRITPPPVIYSHYNDQPLDFALWRHGFSVSRTELTQAVPLDFIDEELLLDGFVNKSRTAFRKAEREGLSFRIIDHPTQAEYDRFWVILEENRRGLGVVPTHNREEIERLHQLVPENLMMATVERDGEMVAVIWNFVCNEETVLEFYMAHVADAQIYRPVPFLTYHSLLWAKAQGYKWFDFGISSIWGDPTWGLLKFKENFRARHFLRQSFTLDL